jgi:hypothetical protein
MVLHYRAVVDDQNLPLINAAFEARTAQECCRQSGSANQQYRDLGLGVREQEGRKGFTSLGRATSMSGVRGLSRVSRLRVGNA